MVIDLNLFTQTINVLKANSIDEIKGSLESLNMQEQLAEDKYEQALKELRRLLILFKKYEIQVNTQKQIVTDEKIQPLVPLIKQQQEASVFADVRTATVTQVINAKKELDSMDASVEEMKLRLFSQAREAKLASNDLAKIESQCFILETAIDIVEHFNIKGFNIQETSDYEIPKYFELYRKGR